MKSKYTIPVAIVVGGLIIAGALYASMPKKSSDSVRASLVRPVSTADHIFGNPAAPVVIIEYADFDCAPCAEFHDILNHIVANDGARGEVAWVFRHYPLIDAHPNASLLARASECAASSAGADPIASNNAFWRFANVLFLAQPVTPSELGTLAASANIPGTAFASCYAKPPSGITSRIEADRENALQMGALGAPFSVILANGKSPIVIDASYPYDVMRQIVTQALGK
jgi:protein-disulfide isomerase